MKIKWTFVWAWLAVAFFVPKAWAADPVTLIPAGAVWKYLDDGSNQGTEWVASGFVDDAWSSGPAELGYGDGDETTPVSFGPDASNKFTTTYFRHSFNVSNPSQFMSLRVRLVRDDGAVVYLNGTEVWRSNMPEGDITFQTFAAPPAVGGADETTFFETNIDPGLLADGNNVVAVELHQVNLTSSDLGFNLELIASADPVINIPPTVSLTAPLNNATYSPPASITLFANAADSDGTISLVEFYQGATKLGESSSAPYSYAWTGVPLGNYQLTAVATDNLGAKTTSDPVNVYVVPASAPFVVNVSPTPGTLSSLTSITVTFSEAVVGVEAANLQINGEPAVSFSGAGNTYTFAFNQPLPGLVNVFWDVDHVITDQDGVSFDETVASASWSYNLVDQIAPTIARQSPAYGATVTSLTQFQVEFSEPVTGVSAGDLRVAGQAATSVTGTGAGPYVFTFAQPASGSVSLQWAAGHGIQDLASIPNAFAGGSGNVTLNPAFAADIVINEILADNLTSLADEDRQKQDWIELRNRGNATVNLIGWSLSDDPADPGKWVLPSLSLGAGQFVIIYASGKDRTTTALGTTNHTNFRLNVVGGYLGLFNANFPRQVAHEFNPDYPELRGDISYGLRSDGSRSWFGSSTPGAANSDAAALSGIVAPPNPSVNSGLFNHAFPLTLSTPTPGARIFYTLDGSVPTESSQEYLGPVQIEGNPRKGAMIVRAAAFVSGQLPSLVVTRTYIFPENVLTQPNNPDGFPLIWDSPCTGFNNCNDINPADYEMDPQVINDQANNYRNLALEGFSSIPTVSIVSDVDLLFSAAQGVYVRREPFLRQPINAEFIPPDGSEGFRIDCGLEMQGQTSPDDSSTGGSRWKSLKLGLRLFFQGEFGATKLHYKVFEDSPVDSFDTLMLAGGHNNYWNYNNNDTQRTRALYVRDQYVANLQNLLGGRSHHGRFVHLYLNGLYWGLYFMHERPDASFAASYFGGEKEDYDVFKHDLSQVVDGSNASYSAMWSIINAGLASNANYEALQQQLDVPGLIDYLLINYWCNNTDWDHKNLYASHRKQGGLWRFHAWDSEHVLADANYGVLDDNNGTNPTAIFKRLLSNAEFKILFADHVQKHFYNDGIFYTDPAHPVYDPAHPERTPAAAMLMKMLQGIDTAIVCESARWGDVGPGREDNPHTRNVSFYDERDIVLGARATFGSHSSFSVANRTAGLLNEFRNRGWIPNVVAPSFNQHGGRVVPGFNLTISAPAGTIYYTTNGADPRVYGSGAVSGHAVAYNGTPVILNASTQVKARVLSGGVWSALNEALFNIEELTVPLRITEIMYNPVGGDAYEFLELRNVGVAPIDLGFASFQGINYAFPAGASIAPGVTLILANNANPAAFATRYPGVAVYDYFGGGLANGGETIRLVDVNGHTLLSVDYNDANGWPTEPDGQGNSLELIDVDGYSSDPANWRSSLSANGTPGLPPSAVPAPSVVLNEVASENLSSWNVDGIYPDWVELRNNGGAQINLGGWSLSDGDDPRHFVFPDPTLVPAGGYLLVYCDNPTNASTGLHAGFALDRDGDGLFLYDGNTNRIDAVTFGRIPADYTLGRIAGEWQLTVTTPGEDNVAAETASASNLALNEWLANPLVGGDDWLELYNRSATAPVALRGLYFGTSNALFQIRSHSFLPAHGFIQLFAEERSGANELDFKLPAAGGTIILYDRNGLELESVTYGPQTAGVSAGRLPDGNAQSMTTFPGSVSPAAANYLLQYTGPIFTELLARNQSAVAAPWGEYADFVELQNTGASTFDLSGMSLGSSPDKVGEFVFPAGTTLGANARLVVWCDGSRVASTNAGPDLNAGFSLDGNSGGIYLFTAGGQSATGVAYGFQVANLSIGLNGASWGLLASPTPGSANTGAATLGLVNSLRINEWMAAPDGGDDWFEIYNRDALPVRLDGIYVTDDPAINGQMKSSFEALSFIGGNSWLRWEADGSPSKGGNHAAFSLDAAGEAILLYDVDGSVIDTVTFGWQTSGVSQGRLPDGEGSIVTFSVTATPEESNYLPVPELVVSEILSHTDIPLEDAIELQNISGQPLDISGWYLSDSQGDFRKYQIPAGTVLGPGEYKVFYEYQLNGGPGSLVPFTFDSVRGDEAWLSQAAGGNLTGFRAQSRFGASANGVSFGRYVTSVGVDFPPQVTRSFGVDNPASVDQFRQGTGKENAGPKVGPVVINEIMYHPPGAPEGEEAMPDEYLELFNLTTENVDLFDPAHQANTWKLTEAVSYVFPEEVTLPSRSYLLIVGFDPINDPAALAAFRAAHGIPVSVPIYGPFKGGLANDGERVELKRPDTPQGAGPDQGYVPYLLVDAVRYDDGYPWSTEADGGGASLQRRRPGNYANDPVNWKGDAPTPGRANVNGYGYVDTDLDGMPDEYESANSFNPNSASDADQNADGDARTNFEEFLDATDPRNPASVLLAPGFVQQPQNKTISIGASLTLSVLANGAAPLNYQWYKNGLAIPGANSADYTVASAQPSDTGRYHVTVWNAAGFSVSQPATVSFPLSILVPPQSQTVNVGDDATFTVTALGLGSLRYQWLFNNTPIPGATGPALTIESVEAGDAGPYAVIVFDDESSVISEPASLSLLGLAPSFVRHPQSQTNVVGADVTFTVITQGTLPISYRWRQGSLTLTNVTLNSYVSSVTLKNIQLADGGSTRRITVILTNAVFVSPGVISQSAILTVLPDTDQDGIDDATETSLGLNPNNPADGLLDDDGDGMSNSDEYTAGTDMKDPLSYLRVEIVSPSPGEREVGVLRFQAVAGRSYSVLYRDKVDDAAWKKLVDVELEQTSREVEVIDSVAPFVSQRVYRLVVPKQVAP